MLVTCQNSDCHYLFLFQQLKSDKKYYQNMCFVKVFYPDFQTPNSDFVFHITETGFYLRILIQLTDFFLISIFFLFETNTNCNVDTVTSQNYWHVDIRLLSIVPTAIEYIHMLQWMYAWCAPLPTATSLSYRGFCAFSRHQILILHFENWF